MQVCVRVRVRVCVRTCLRCVGHPVAVPLLHSEIRASEACECAGKSDSAAAYEKCVRSTALSSVRCVVGCPACSLSAVSSRSCRFPLRPFDSQVQVPIHCGVLPVFCVSAMLQV